MATLVSPVFEYCPLLLNGRGNGIWAGPYTVFQDEAPAVVAELAIELGAGAVVGFMLLGCAFRIVEGGNGNFGG